ncbi:hypothetical protein CLV62_11180 [Dysgonomonas alginatilytica]|uniref:Glycosyl transferase family 2 n=1 Tax=Dysgonomonas alginatilytica TaxID=1605892 RepID=A0A2V3PNF6_9BACT|nr:sugar transferase [Dysgonomonas alginatilytica]PXV64122.1 hypothetical protein CLV62_11180 [Dysgonomonas alginatilytica]
MTEKLAPIVLFVYNRPWHTRQTLEALANNSLAKDSVLYIYADGARTNASDDVLKEVYEVRRIIREKKWCGEVHIIESEVNKGLASSIIDGVTDIINQYGKIVVLEDDIVTSVGFLQYMNDALQLYQNVDRVMHISGFVPVTTGADRLLETYFLRFMSCWGWATWKRSWDQVILDIDYLFKTIPLQRDYKAFNLNGAINLYRQIEDNYHGNINTWAIRWYSTIFLKKGLCLYPRYSMVDNIGIDLSGEHCSSPDDRYNVELAKSIKVEPVKIKESKYGKEYLRRFYIFGTDSSRKKRIRNILFRIYKKIK